MKILLLYNTFQPELHWNCLAAQEKNMGAIPPINLCYVAAIIRECGHAVRLIDLQVEDYSPDALIKEIAAYKPDLLGFTITTYLFHGVLEWIRKIKEAVQVPVLVGGFHMSLYPAETMVHEVIDFGIIGYGEKTLNEFLSVYGAVARYPAIAGLCYREGGRVVVNAPDSSGMDLDALPLPARDLLHNERYGNFISQRKNFTAMLTGIGCPFQCKYCASTTTRCALRSAERVVDEIEECYTRYGIREIDFYDQSFTVNRARTVAICDEIIKRKLAISWTIRTRADLVDEALLVHMKKAGLYRVMYGIESASQVLLDRMGKNERVADIVETVRMTKRLGIAVFGFFMFGVPGETRETLAATKRFALRMPFDEIQVTRFTLFPGTAFHREYMERAQAADYWAAYIADRTHVSKLPLYDTVYTPEQIDREIKQLYLRFYLRPRVVMPKLLQMRRLGKYIRAGIDMVRS